MRPVKQEIYDTLASRVFKSLVLMAALSCGCAKRERSEPNSIYDNNELTSNPCVNMRGKNWKDTYTYGFAYVLETKNSHFPHHFSAPQSVHHASTLPTRDLQGTFQRGISIDSGKSTNLHVCLNSPLKKCAISPCRHRRGSLPACYHRGVVSG